MSQLPHRFALRTAALLLTLGAAQAQVDVAICAAAQTSSTDCRFTDVQAKLTASGLFGTVDIINASSSTPTLQQLQAYDAVLVWSNTSFQDSTLLGNTLADYVDAGGAVVVAVFAVNWNTLTLSIQGRWQNGYEVIADQSGSTTGAASLGTVLLPAHPIMAGVSSFNGGTNAYRPTATVLNPGAIAIAEWSDGRILVAQGANPKRVDLGFYPPSSDCGGSGFWTSSTDGGKLLSNALHFAATSGGLAPTNYCTAGTTTNGCVPSISASAQPSAALSAPCTIDVTDVEGAKQGLIFYGVDNTGFSPLPWGSGSSSFFCVKSPVQRSIPQNSGGVFNTCTGVLTLDWNVFQSSFPGTLGSPFAPGDRVYAQAWFRDPPAPRTTNLSDAIELTVSP